MRTVTVFVGVLAVGMAAGSCVSKKEYLAQVSAAEALERTLQATRQQVTELQADTTALRTGLRARNADIKRLDTEHQQMEEMVAQAEARYRQLKDNYDRLASNSGETTQQLLADRDRLEREIFLRDSAAVALRQKVSQALTGFRDSGLDVAERNGRVYVSLPNQLLFETGETKLDRKGRAALLELATVLKSQPNLDVTVEGHTDNVPVSNLGAIQDNWDLSVLRATEVVRLLTTEGGVPRSRVIAAGRSAYAPVASNDTPEGKARNRRIELVLSPDLKALFALVETTSSQQAKPVAKPAAKPATKTKAKSAAKRKK